MSDAIDEEALVKACEFSSILDASDSETLNNEAFRFAIASLVFVVSACMLAAKAPDAISSTVTLPERDDERADCWEEKDEDAISSLATLVARDDESELIVLVIDDDNVCLAVASVLIMVVKVLTFVVRAFDRVDLKAISLLRLVCRFDMLTF